MGTENFEPAVVEACNNILRIITHGDRAHVMRKEDEVLLIGDKRDLSPLYTESLAKVIRERQGKTGGQVNVRYLPEKRPITDAGQIDPSIGKLAARADIIIGTYSNPGEQITHAEQPALNQAFFKTIFGRVQDKDIRLYVVAGRPTVRVLETLANNKAIEETNTLSKQLRYYLRAKAGKEMEAYTLKEGRSGDALKFTIPQAEMITADYFEANEHLINIPSGEVFFEPVPDTAKGKIYLKEGSYYHLNIPIKGMIIVEFENGEIKEVRDLGRQDQEVHDFITKHLEVKENRHLAEMGIGTYLAGSAIPMSDLTYNRTILEKLQGFHIAYGSSVMIKGKHDAPEHIDNWVRYGDVFIGGEHLISKGRINTKLVKSYAKQ